MNQSVIRVSCKYGRNCYRSNAAHRFENSHPGDADYKMPTEQAPSGAPLCPYGVTCYRRRPLHFKLFSHSVSTTSTQKLILPLNLSRSPSSLAQASLNERIPLASENENSDNDTISLVPENENFGNGNFENENEVTLITNIRPENKEQTIKGRVIIKSDKHPFFSKFGPGVMFSINVVDRSGETRLLAYGACVDAFFDKIQVNQIYKFKNFKVNSPDLQFNKNTKIEFVSDAESDFPSLNFQFQRLNEISTKKKEDTIDVIAICQNIGSLIPTMLANKCQSVKRELVLVDQTSQVILTIWGSNAESFAKYPTGCVIALKRGRIMNKPAKSSLDASCLKSCTYQINPDIPQAKQLLDWAKSKNNFQGLKSN